MLVSPVFDAALAGVAGLLVGSFLNVVIYRLPLMLERQWAAECADLAGKPPEPAEAFNLVRPRSRCRKCGHAIRWYENIPLLSFVALRGKCSSCGTAIGMRYPVVEAVTGLLFAYCAWRFGITPRAAAWAGFCAAIVALALIDWDTTLLPDDITLPLLWAGLIAAALGWSGLKLTESLWGAVAGYMSLWLIYQGFRLLTGKEGMGFGDFKLFAALGAWFGWQGLVPIILMASITGAIVGIGMKLAAGLREGKYVPFGPFLAAGGLAALFFGSDAILGAIGLERQMLRIGLTGGIGSGKSTVLHELVVLGAVGIDADAISRGTTAAGGAAIPHIARTFGADFVGSDGALDRSRMREHVYADPAARRQLEAIIHPLVAEEAERQVSVAAAKGARCVVFDIPLLVESGRWRRRVDRVLVVDCPEDTQVARVTARSGLKPGEVRAIIAAQAPRAARLAAADIVICNEALSLQELAGEVGQAWRTFGL